MLLLKISVFPYKFQWFGIKRVSHHKYFLRKYAVKPKLNVILDEVVIEGTNPKKHPGIISQKAVEIPKKLLSAIENILKDKPIKALTKDADVLRNYLHSRQPPLEGTELNRKIAEFSAQVEMEVNINKENLSEEERNHLKILREGRMKQLLGQRVYNWASIDYSDAQCLAYLLARCASNYAVLIRVFTEMKSKAPEFYPRTLFDFGSGIGTVMWAVRNTWDSVKEYFCVDSSRSMIDLADLLLKNGQENSEPLLSGVFFRQFLPSSQTLKYDLVVSAYSLMDLPSSQSRLQTVMNLWNKTSGYLVLIESGTNAGFSVVNEARDFILEFTKRSDQQAHVFAPCPHELQCPKINRKKPCTFPVRYLTLPIGKNQVTRNEIFSYVVLKKGSRSDKDPEWPRLIEPTLVRSKHSICRMCCSDGELKEVTFTASRHGKFVYHCARASKWGDLLPIHIFEDEVQ